MLLFFFFALYFECMIKKEQDNGCNRSSKKVKMFRFNYVLKENMDITRSSSFTSTSFFFLGGGGGGGGGRRQQIELEEMYHSN